MKPVLLFVLGVVAAITLSTSTRAQINDDKSVMPRAPKGAPTPKGPDGHPDFTGVYHSPGYGPDDPPRGANTIARNIARDLKESDVPLNEYGKKLMAERTANNSKDDPEGLCLPMGTPRKDPYPWRIIHTPKLMVILYEGNIHSYRQIFLDGRPHDKRVEETWWGDSIGHWEGDTLVVDTVGFNDRAWLDLVGHPRTSKAHIIERFTRPELGRVNIDITIDDPGAYTKPWSVTESAQLAPGWEIMEYICNENNRDLDHLVGK